ncbi:hypothetical protein [Streptomyces sp. NPDC047009]|uniref:hypothetical protein n=1 Tax=Streptomyces sp. NPDC047009 TaxID=3154496 RepID=UPI0033DFC008
MTEQTVGQRGTDIVLECELRLEDMTEAVRLMMRKRGGLSLLYRPVSLLCIELLGVVALTAGLRGDDSTGVAFGVMFILWPVLMFRVPRMTARRMLRANQHHGVMRVTVGEEGVRLVSAHVDSRTAWANYGSYAESDRCFLLRSPDRAGTFTVVLVKRGARTPGDVERLRVLLDSKLPRA